MELEKINQLHFQLMIDKVCRYFKLNPSAASLLRQNLQYQGVSSCLA